MQSCNLSYPQGGAYLVFIVVIIFEEIQKKLYNFRRADIVYIPQTGHSIGNSLQNNRISKINLLLYGWWVVL